MSVEIDFNAIRSLGFALVRNPSAAGEPDIMKNVYARTLFCLVCFNAFLAIACSAQKPASKGDDWAMQNAGIDSVEIAAGTSRQIQVTYPVPDGPIISAESKRYLVYGTACEGHFH